MRHQKGQALIETAFILPLLLLMIFAVFDYARYMYTRNTLNNAARAGARMAAVDPSLTAAGESGPVFPTGTTTPTAQVLQKNIFNGIPSDDSVTYQVKVMDAATGNAVSAVQSGNVVQVTVRWSTFQMVTPIYTFLSWITGNTVEDQSTRTILGEASMRRE